MWLVAPDGGCVGTGEPAVVDRGDGSAGRAGARRFPVWGRARQTSGAFPWYGRRDGAVHQGRRAVTPPAACHDRRVMSPPSVRPPPCRWAATAIPPPAASPAAPAGADGVGPRQPPLVGRRGAGLPRRARRRPRRRRLPLVPGGAAGGRRAPARGRRRPAGAGDRLRLGAVRPVAAPRGCRRRRARPLGRACCARAAELNRSTGIDVPLLQADAGALPLAVGVGRRRLLGLRRAAVRRRRRGRAGRGGAGAAARRAVRRLGEPPDALAVPRLPRPRGPPGHLLLLRPAALRGDRRRTGAPSTSSTTARSATGCGPSSAPVWCSRTWSSRSGRRAARRTGASGPRAAR